MLGLIPRELDSNKVTLTRKVEPTRGSWDNGFEDKRRLDSAGGDELGVTKISTAKRKEMKGACVGQGVILTQNSHHSNQEAAMISCSSWSC